MAIWLDAGILILALLFIFVGFHRGVVKSLIELIGTVGAVVAAVLLASMIAPAIFNTFIRPPMVEQIQGAIDNTVGQDIAARVQQVLEALPQFLSQSLAGYGMSTDQIGEAMMGSTDNAAGAVADLFAPAVTDLIQTVLMLILFLLLLILVRLLAKGVDRIFGLPVLRQLNAVLGAVFGLFKCAVFVLIVCAVLRVVLPMFPTVPEIFSQETIQSSLLFQYLYDNNPVYSLLQFWL